METPSPGDPNRAHSEPILHDIAIVLFWLAMVQLNKGTSVQTLVSYTQCRHVPLAALQVDRRNVVCLISGHSSVWMHRFLFSCAAALSILPAASDHTAPKKWLEQASLHLDDSRSETPAQVCTTHGPTAEEVELVV